MSLHVIRCVVAWSATCPCAVVACVTTTSFLFTVKKRKGANSFAYLANLSVGVGRRQPSRHRVDTGHQPSANQKVEPEPIDHLRATSQPHTTTYAGVSKSKPFALLEKTHQGRRHVARLPSHFGNMGERGAPLYRAWCRRHVVHDLRSVSLASFPPPLNHPVYFAEQRGRGVHARAGRASTDMAHRSRRLHAEGPRGHGQAAGGPFLRVFASCRVLDCPQLLEQSLLGPRDWCLER